MFNRPAVRHSDDTLLDERSRDGVVRRGSNSSDTVESKVTPPALLALRERYDGVTDGMVSGKEALHDAGFPSGSTYLCHMLASKPLHDGLLYGGV